MTKIILFIIFIPLNLFLLTAGGFGYLGDPYTVWAANLYNAYLIPYMLLCLYWCVILLIGEKDKPKVYEVLHEINRNKKIWGKILGRTTIWTSCILAFMFGWFVVGTVILLNIALRWIVYQTIKQYVFEKMGA